MELYLLIQLLLIVISICLIFFNSNKVINIIVIVVFVTQLAFTGYCIIENKNSNSISKCHSVVNCSKNVDKNSNVECDYIEDFNDPNSKKERIKCPSYYINYEG